MTTTPQLRTLSADHALELGDDLIRQLTEHIGDPAAIDAVFRRWIDVLDVRAFSQVCMATLQTVFTDCLTPTTREDWPVRALALTPPRRSSR